MGSYIERDTNSPRDHPKESRTIHSDYYSIRFISEDTADVFLFPESRIYDIGDGRHEYDVSAFIVHGVHVWPGLEDFIRTNYQMLCDIGDPMY